MKSVLLMMMFTTFGFASLNWEVEALDFETLALETEEVSDAQWLGKCKNQSKMVKYLESVTSKRNVLHLEVHCLEQIGEAIDDKIRFKIDAFWRDINFFGKYNTMEEGSLVEITLDKGGEPMSWEIMTTGILTHKGVFPIEDLPTPPRRLGETWISDDLTL
jgi:hypothetical protein